MKLLITGGAGFIRSDQYPTAAVRPKNTVMNNDKFSHIFNVRMINWEKSLSDFIQSNKII
jgi:dTDP-4-dehydrorhamnose reductase